MHHLFAVDNQNQMSHLSPGEIFDITRGSGKVVMIFPPVACCKAYKPILRDDRPWDYSILKHENDTRKECALVYKKVKHLVDPLQSQQDVSIVSTSYLDNKEFLNGSYLRAKYNEDNTIDDKTLDLEFRHRGKNGRLDISMQQDAAAFMLRFVTQSGKRLPIDEAQQKISRLTIFTHSAGATSMAFANNIMRKEMAGLGYNNDEIKQLMSNVYAVCVAPPIQLTNNNEVYFKTLTFEYINDKVVQKNLSEHANKDIYLKNKDIAIYKNNNDQLTVIGKGETDFMFFNNRGQIMHSTDSDAHSMRAFMNYKSGKDNTITVMIDNAIKNILTKDVRDIQLEDLLKREITPYENKFSAVRNIYSRVINEIVDNFKGLGMKR